MEDLVVAALGLDTVTPLLPLCEAARFTLKDPEHELLVTLGRHLGLASELFLRRTLQLPFEAVLLCLRENPEGLMADLAGTDHALKDPNRRLVLDRSALVVDQGRVQQQVAVCLGGVLRCVEWRIPCGVLLLFKVPNQVLLVRDGVVDLGRGRELRNS